MFLHTLALSVGVLAAVTPPASPPPPLVPGAMSFFLPAHALAQLEAQIEAAGQAGLCDHPELGPVKGVCLRPCHGGPGNPWAAPTPVSANVSSLSLSERDRTLATLLATSGSFAGDLELSCGRFHYEIESDPSALEPDSVVALSPGDTSPAEGPFTGILRLAMNARFFPLDPGVASQMPVLLELELEGRWSTTSPQPGFTPWSNLALTPNPVPPWVLHPECWESCPMPVTDVLSYPCPGIRNKCLDIPPELGGTGQ